VGERAAAIEDVGDAASAGIALHAGLPPLSDADFQRYQALVNDAAGIQLSSAKKALVVGRLARRLRELGIGSWRAYHDLALSSEAERVRLLDAISTNETHFFREPHHWEFLASQVLPGWIAAAEARRRARRVRVWSAACSTGEEPYTIAMLLLAALPEGWDLEIIATDISTKVLERARRAVWPLEKAAEIPEAYRKAFMLRGTGEQAGLMRAGPELRALCRFGRLNLKADAYPPGPFDLVFCRNVLIYFDRDSKAQVLDRLLDRLAPGGHLLLGHAETLSGLSTRASAVLPTVYVLPPEGPAPAGRD
jgi:chemotaxis protein methyltransferase CheR